jgi:tRNA U34 5-methylaminomethyl-2-thiouridine-forming methyltransferase MnmC
VKNKLVITNDGSHSIFNPEINECYHSKHGAIVEAEHVFIRNGFSTVNKPYLNILEIGFGTGLNTLLTSQKAIQKEITVDYQTIELYPVIEDNYSKLNFTDLIGIEQNELLKLHTTQWEKKCKINEFFSLTKFKTDLENYTSESKFDIIYFDAFSPEKQPELWTNTIFMKMHNYLKEDGFLVTYCAKGIVKRTMKSVGFKIIVLDGPPGKRQMTKANKLILKNVI